MPHGFGQGVRMTEMVHGGGRAAGRMEPVMPRWWRTIDRWTLLCVAALYAVGILLALAASVPLAERQGLTNGYHYVARQLMFGSLAGGTLLVASALPVRVLRRLACIGFAASLVALMALPLLGTDLDKGATRWFSLGFATVQPSEFLKPVFVVVAAWLIASEDVPGGPPGRAVSLGLLAIVVGLLVAQPDYGQSALLVFSWMVMWFVAGASVLKVCALVGTAGGLMALAYRSSEHVAGRIDGFLRPEVSPFTQRGAADSAIREGGYFGVGPGEGVVKWRLPDAHTDYVIAVAAEEFGLVLVVLVIALYLAVVLRALGRLVHEEDAFVRLAGTGLACTFGVQALINLGVAARLLPAKGMTLPLVSYGGSSLVATGITLGMLLAFTRRRTRGGLGSLIA